jgi:hypothetical protein
MEQERRGAASRRRGHRSSPLRRHRRRGHRSGGAESPVAATSAQEMERPREKNGMLGLRVRLTRHRRRLIRLNGPAPCRGLRGPGSCLHHGPTWQPKHGTGTGPGWHGHAGRRAGPSFSRAWACRVPGCTTGRPVLDMYTGHQCSVHHQALADSPHLGFLR